MTIQTQKYHQLLSDYFHSKDYFLESIEEQRDRSKRFPPSPRPVNTRKVVELPWQRIQSQDWDAVEKLFMELSFLEAKNECGKIFDLVRDFSLALVRIPLQRPYYQILKLLEEALRRDIHFIHQHHNDYPQGLFQCLWNLVRWYDVDVVNEHFLITSNQKRVSSIKIAEVVESFKNQKEIQTPDFPWIYSIRPPRNEFHGSLLRVFKGHDHAVNSAKFTRDKNHIISVDSSACVWKWDLETGSGEILKSWKDEDSNITMDLSPDGRRIACAGGGRVVRIHNILDGTEQVLKDYGYSLSSVSWSPDGRYIAGVGVHCPEIYIWACENSELFRIIYSSMGHLVVRFISPVLAAVSGMNGKIEIWNVETGLKYLTKPIEGHKNWIVDMAISPNGKRLLSGSWDHTARIWRLPSGKPESILNGYWDIQPNRQFRNTIEEWKFYQNAKISGEHTDKVTCVAWSPNNKKLATGCYDGIVRQWDCHQPNRAKLLQGHNGPVNSVSFSYDSSYLVSAGGSDQVICLWKVSNSKVRLLKNHRNRITAIGFSWNGKFLATGDQDGVVGFWEIPSGKLICFFGENNEHNGGILCVQPSSNGNEVVVGTKLGGVALWFFPNNKEQMLLMETESGTNHDMNKQAQFGCWLTPSPNGIFAPIWDISGNVGFSKDGFEVIASIGSDGMIWEPRISTKRARPIKGEDNIKNILGFPKVPLSLIARTLDVENDGASWVISQSSYIFPSQMSERYIGTETEIYCSKTDMRIALFPDPLHKLTAHPNGKIWAGVMDNHLILLRLEGDF